MIYQSKSNQIIIEVKRAPLFMLIIYYLFTTLFFILPFVSVTLFVVFNRQFHFGFIFLFALFGVLGFFLLRSSLWNSFGKEIIEKKACRIGYIADYNWFKYKVKSIDIKDSVKIKIEPHYNDGKFKLTIVSTNNKDVIETAIPLEYKDAQLLKIELEKMILE